MGNGGDPQGYRLSRGYRWYGFALLFSLYLFDYTDRMVVTSLFPFIQKDWGITDTQCGLLVSAVYWSIVLFTFPVSVLVDRWSRRKSIGLMALLWSVATGLCALTRSFPQLFLARTAIGLGEAGYAPGGTAMIAGLFPREQRARVMGLWNASIPLGSALGIALGGLIATRWGWRHAFGLVALPGLVVAVLFFFIPDYRTVPLVRTASAQMAQVRMTLADIVRRFIRTPTLVLTYLGFAASIFVTTSLITWLPTYFHRTAQIPIGEAGLKTGLVMMLAVVGSPLGGFLADAWLRRRVNARLVFCALTALVSAGFLFVTVKLFPGTGVLQYLGFLGVGLTIMAFVPAASAATQDVVHPGLRAMAYALCVVFQNLLGASLGPFFVGALSDTVGIARALAVLPLFLVISSFFFAAGARCYERDLNRVERIPLEAEKGG
jgi:MFS family permease